MSLSVVIPTHGRPGKLLCCLEGLAAQALKREHFEVLVGVDGGSREEESTIRAAMGSLGLSGQAISLPKRGPAYVRNRLIERAAGPLLLLLNDDVTPHPDCLLVHAEAQGRLAAGGQAAMVLGDAPWKINEPDRLFDRLIRETSMVFFYDRMQDDLDPDRDWGFRHAWTLNLSLPKRLVAEAGWFSESLPSPRFEDIELAWRLCSRGARVLYCPSARVEHDHRYEARQYLEREYLLGYDAWFLALANGTCARAIFGRDITDQAELSYTREHLRRERSNAVQFEKGFLSLAELPADAVGAHGDELTKLLYQQHLALKRYVWRQGLLCAAEQRPARYEPLSESAPADAHAAGSDRASRSRQALRTVPRP